MKKVTHSRHELVQLFAFTVLFSMLTVIPPGVIAEESEPDPLPSWKEGIAKQKILQFVRDVTDESGTSYVIPEERVAVFDNDGTLWTEKPLYFQLAFLFQRIDELAKVNPEWKTKQPFKAVLERDRDYLHGISTTDLMRLVIATHTGVTESEFAEHAKLFLENEKHPRFNVLYKEVVYQPMLELLEFLRANDFKVYICSGGGQEFIRIISEEVYGIPRENVIASSVQYEFRKTEHGPVLVRKPAMVSVCDRETKPVHIQLHVGRVPILAFGNSDGDLQMLHFTDDGKGPALMLLLQHDDPDREYFYHQGADVAIEAAKEHDWTIVSIKKDFKTVFAFQEK